MFYFNICDIIGDWVNCLCVTQRKYLTCLWKIGCGNDVNAAGLIFHINISFNKLSKGKDHPITGHKGTRGK
jgi:hypothetical protein